MQISNRTSQTFSGYGARPLEYLIIRPHMRIHNRCIIEELNKVAKQSGIKLILDSCEKVTDRIPVSKEQFSKYKSDMFLWAQDRFYFYKNKFFKSLSEDNNTALNWYLGLEQKNVDAYDFIAGGNLFFIKDKGEEKILVGAGERVKKIKAAFGDEKIIEVPQANFHIDMFIRPLKDNVILAADDSMTLNIINKAYNKLKALVDKGKGNEIYKTNLKKLEEAKQIMTHGCTWTSYEDTGKVIEALKSEGFKVVRVPGRVYSYDRENDITDYINFMNAIVHEKQNGELVYITNDVNYKNDLGLTDYIAKKIGLDLKMIFKEAVKDYIKPEDIYFLRGSKGKAKEGNIPALLKENHGGIHCMTVEVPKGILPENITEKFDTYV